MDYKLFPVNKKILEHTGMPLGTIAPRGSIVFGEPGFTMATGTNKTRGFDEKWLWCEKGVPVYISLRAPSFKFAGAAPLAWFEIGNSSSALRLAQIGFETTLDSINYFEVCRNLVGDIQSAVPGSVVVNCPIVGVYVPLVSGPVGFTMFAVQHNSTCTTTLHDAVIEIYQPLVV